MPGLHLGKVQDIVDQVEQVRPCALKDTNIVLLGLAERGLRQNVCHAQNGIHRGSHFMTHGRQEFALGTIGGFRACFGALKIFLRALAYYHLPELRANMPQHIQELFIRTYPLNRIELQNSDNLLFHQYRESEPRPKPGLRCCAGSLWQRSVGR